MIEPTGVTQEGVNTGAFSFFFIFIFCPIFLLRVLAFIYIARTAQPSLSLVNGASVEVWYYELFQLFSSVAK